jgi:hypothetical protein
VKEAVHSLPEEVKESIAGIDEPLNKVEAPKQESQQPEVKPREVEQVEEEEKVQMRPQTHPKTSGAADTKDAGDESDT